MPLPIPADQAPVVLEGACLTVPLDPWVTVDQLSAYPRLVATPPPDGTDLADCIDVASELLYEWSGHRHGTRTYTVRPAVERAVWAVWLLGGGEWWVDTAAMWRGDYSDARRCPLPRPVCNVAAVEVDGVTLAGSAWQVYDRDTLVRVDGQSWPCAQDLSVASGPGTWFVTFTQGVAPSPAARRAALELAAEVALIGTGSCRLPAFMTQQVRQGSTRSFQQRDLKNRVTGLGMVDMYLSAANPSGKRRRSTIASPDTVRIARPTG